jgi:azurin
MSQTPSHSSEESGSIWSVLNLVIGAALALFAGFWGLAFVIGGFQAAQKIRAPKPAPAVAAAPAAPAPSAPATAEAAKPAATAPVAAGPAQELQLGPDAVQPMAYNKKAFKVKAGQPVKLTFTNVGAAAPLPHNVVIGNAGSKDAMTAAAVAMMTDPQGMAKNFVPADPIVIAATKLVNAGQSESITFTPATPGEYPFLCTFPGHYIMMNGVITAE